MLGATPPKVKGLPDVRFAEGETDGDFVTVEFAEGAKDDAKDKPSRDALRALLSSLPQQVGYAEAAVAVSGG